MALIGAYTIASAPSFADDIPAGTDVALFLNLATLSPEVEPVWDDVLQLTAVQPGMALFARKAAAQLIKELHLGEALTGATLTKRDPQKGLTLRLYIDLDATGGVIYSAVFTEPSPKNSNPVDIHTLGVVEELAAKAEHDVARIRIDDRPAFRVAQVLWTIDEYNRLVFGNERGLQRQLRARRDKSQIQRLARQIRHNPPAILVFNLPDAKKQAWALDFSDFGAALLQVKSGFIAATGNTLNIQLHSANKNTREIITHTLQAGASIIRAEAHVLEAASHMLLMNKKLEQDSKIIPDTLKTDEMQTQLSTWIEDFALKGKVLGRGKSTTEANFTITDYRPLVALGVFIFSRKHPPLTPAREARVLLRVLRSTERRYRKRHGTYLSCGPWPRRVPRNPQPWVQDQCFEKLGFSPPKPTALQIQAKVSTEDGGLLLIAKNKNTAGKIQVFVLNDESDIVHNITE